MNLMLNCTVLNRHLLELTKLNIKNNMFRAQTIDTSEWSLSNDFGTARAIPVAVRRATSFPLLHSTLPTIPLHLVPKLKLSLTIMVFRIRINLKQIFGKLSRI